MIGWTLLVVAIVGLGLYWRSQHRKPKQTTIRPDQVMHDDPLAQQVIAECWNSGKTVHASRDKDGNQNVEVCDE